MLQDTASFSETLPPLDLVNSQANVLPDTSTCPDDDPMAFPVFRGPFVYAKLPARSQSALVQKLNAFARLGDDEIEALEALSRSPKSFRRDHILVHEGSSSDWIYLVISGLVCRYKMLADGRRQILGYLIPGDVCDFHFTIANRPDHSVAVVGESSLARISIKTFRELIDLYPKIGRAMTLAALKDTIVLREWLLNVGQRDAMQKLSHFFCEMEERVEASGGMDADGSFALPVNQVTLADTLGLTPVHINRTLRRLRGEGLIRFCHRRLKILDRDRLSAIGDFNGTYLHMYMMND